MMHCETCKFSFPFRKQTSAIQTGYQMRTAQHNHQSYRTVSSMLQPSNPRLITQHAKLRFRESHSCSCISALCTSALSLR